MRRVNQTGAALLAVLLWSTNALTARYVLDRAEVSWLLLLEGLFATAFLLIVRIRLTRQPRPATRIVALGVLGLAGTMTLQYLAYAHAPVVAANVLTYVWPLAAAAWFALTLRTRSALLSGLGAVVGFAGVAVVLIDGTGGSGSGPGYLFALASAGCMAVFSVAGRRIDGIVDVLLPATVVTATIGGGWVIVSGAPVPSVGVCAVTAVMGTGQMAIGYLLWTRAMRGRGAERLSGLGYVTPLLSTVLLLATGAPVTTAILLSAGLILLGSAGVLAVDLSSAGTRERRGDALSRRRTSLLRGS